MGPPPRGPPEKPLKEGFDMNHNAVFDSPFLLGFEQLERLVERTLKSANDGYPPYNIEASDTQGGLCITLAVAGFRPEDLAVTQEGNQLVIRGRQSEAGEKNFLHRGIAARQFQRAFVLADGITVSRASLENGLLRITLLRPKAEPAVRNIAITSSKDVGKGG
jgi:HSP20 family molecular chaperone IbpA